MDEWEVSSHHTHQQHKVKVNRFYTWAAPCSGQLCKQPSQFLYVPNLCQDPDITLTLATERMQRSRDVREDADRCDQNQLPCLAIDLPLV